MKRPLAAFLTLALTACNGDAPGQWSAIIYANGHDQSEYVTTRGFQSLSMCRQAAKDSIAALPEPAKADYRCAFQCDVDPAAPGLNKNCKSMEK